jgi:proline dehydrogenase
MLKSLLLYMSEQPRIQRLATTLQVSRRVALRFVAGEKIIEAVEAVRVLNGKGFSATLDYLGEMVTKREEAGRAT